MTMYRIVDVCGTLVKDDTTVGLLDWHFSRNHRWRHWILLFFTARFSPLRLLVAVVEKLSGKHLLKHLLVRMLQGDSIDAVQASADQYAEWLLAHRKIEGVWRLLGQTSQSGPLVLASASLGPVVEALAVRLNADYVASSLATKDGVYLGHYESDLTGIKIKALDRHLPPAWRLAPYMAISDNLTDRKLLQGAHQAFVVLHDGRRRNRWDGVSAEFISV